MRPYVLLVLACYLGLSSAQANQERPVRLDDIERDNLKSPQQTPQQPRPSALQYQHPSNLQYQQQAQYQYQQSPLLLQYNPVQQYYQNIQGAQPSAYQQMYLSQQPQQPVLIPQHQSLPFPVMLIPSSYLLPQDLNALLYNSLGAQQQQQAAKYQQAPQAQQLVQPTPIKGGFRPSPQIGGSAQPSPLVYQTAQAYQTSPQQYNAYQTLYQQKYATGAKSTVAPPLKDNYVGQGSNVAPAYATYKLQ